ncbi:hypothetical protein [Methylobacterium goesingense]|uniref:Uncharacterized protein n=1 Tax=Methylobacterium goesingense TaxID=243690 RepID=A0ABV2L162_9HYPH|nr:hypothetical protein [Methylobacterium goesingense]GJD74468.1 hypothetical protein CFIICLFH_2702 [Methylobacterium goesingense]
MRLPSLRFAAALACAGVCALPLPAAAQSTGYVTGFPGKDPAGDDEIGWGPAYRPETSFSQPGTPPTPGDFAGAAYRARTGRGPYDAVQGTGLRGARFAPDDAVAEPSRRRHRAVRHHPTRGRHADR